MKIRVIGLKLRLQLSLELSLMLSLSVVLKTRVATLAEFKGRINNNKYTGPNTYQKDSISQIEQFPRLWSHEMTFYHHQEKFFFLHKHFKGTAPPPPWRHLAAIQHWCWSLAGDWTTTPSKSAEQFYWSRLLLGQKLSWHHREQYFF